MANDNQVEIEFLVKEELTKALNNITKGMDKFGKQTKKTSSTAEKAFSKLGKVAESALGFGIADLSIKAAAAFGDFVKQGVTDALALEQALQSLDLQTQNTAKNLVRELRTATDGLATDLGLAQAANKALALGIRKDDLEGLFEASAARAKIMGITVEQAVNDIATGIGRASPLILDNLGIIINAEETYKQYAKSIDTTAESLTKLEKTQALTTSTIKSSEGAVLAFGLLQDTNSAKIERAKTTIENFKASVGGIPAEFIAAATELETLTAAALRTDEGFQSLVIQGKESAATFLEIEKNVRLLSDSVGTLTDDLQKLADEPLQSEIDAQREINRLSLEQLNLKKQIGELTTTLEPDQIKHRDLFADDTDVQTLTTLETREETINNLLKEQRDLIKTNQLERKVALDEAIIKGEAEGTILKKNKTSIDELKLALDERLISEQKNIELLEEYNEKLDTQRETMSYITEDMERQREIVAEQIELIIENTDAVTRFFATLPGQ